MQEDLNTLDENKHGILLNSTREEKNWLSMDMLEALLKHMEKVYIESQRHLIQ